MDIETIHQYCISKPGVTEEFPFDESTLVFKVAGKMFALTGLDASPKFINLKCDPERAVELREEYNSITPGYHMNKKHWNSLYFEDSDVPPKLILELIDHSYTLVVNSLPKKTQNSLQNL